jgi:S1-C subfamily serine protease
MPGRGGWLTLGLALVLAGLLAGCATSAGVPARGPMSGFMSRAVGQAYLPLQGTVDLLFEGEGVGVVIAPGIAATNAHNADLVDPASVLGTSTNYDLLFFRTDRGRALPYDAPRAGEPVIAYGQGVDGELRQARGTIRYTDAPVLPRCKGCPVQRAFAFEAEGGKGFSGGPVVDASSARLVGIVFGFRGGPDGKTPSKTPSKTLGHRLMYAYDMERVFAELSALKPASATPLP